MMPSLYRPPHFDETRIPVLHEAIRALDFGSLVTVADSGPVASHVPMLLDAEPGPLGRLRGHIARGNPQWRETRAEIPALAIFLGPDAYISPAWYPTKRESGKVVPTWNYVAVHGTGMVRFFDDAKALRDIVTRLTERHESRRAEPWAVSDAPADYIETMLKGIVGFELVLTALEGKWKMSQNRPAEDRAGTAAGLAREGGAEEKDVARIVAEQSAKPQTT